MNIGDFIWYRKPWGIEKFRSAGCGSVVFYVMFGDDVCTVGSGLLHGSKLQAKKDIDRIFREEK